MIKDMIPLQSVQI